MQSSSSRFINPSAFLLAGVCNSRHMFAQVCCVHVCMQAQLAERKVCSGSNVFTSRLLALHLGVSTPFPGHLLPAPTVGFLTNRMLLTPFRWAADVLWLVDGGRAQKVKTQAWEFSETSPPPLWLSRANICFQSQFLQRPPPSSHFSKAPTGERFLGFS